MDNSKTKTYDALMLAFHEMREKELMTLHNELCNSEDFIYSSLGDVITEHFTTPLQAVTAVLRGNVAGLSEPYYWLDGLGNVRSAVALDDEDSPLSYRDLANWVMAKGRVSEFIDDDDAE